VRLRRLLHVLTPPVPPIFVLSGPRGVGKSSVCGHVAAEVSRRGFRVGGIVTERSEASSVFLAETDSRHLVDLSTGERISFGRRAGEDAPGAWAPAGPDPAFPLGDELTPGWEFGGQTFQFGERAIVSAADADFLVVDELGPLELRGGRGWAAAVPVLRTGEFAAALVVCRTELLAELTTALRPEDTAPAPRRSTNAELPVFMLSVENRGGMFSGLTREILAALSSSR
jgi:nucleoside-triphosphatase THEP1